MKSFQTPKTLAVLAGINCLMLTRVMALHVAPGYIFPQTHTVNEPTETTRPIELVGADEYAMRKDMAWLGVEPREVAARAIVVDAEPAIAVATAEAETETKVAKDDVEKTSADERSMRKDIGWLGLATVEAPEALAAQLNLQSGVGLVVSYVAPDSPASKAGFQKNDLLVRFDDQSLVVPAQFRKLVQSHKSGDAIKLVYFRGGKEQTASVTLGRASANVNSDDKQLFEFKLDGLKHSLQGEGGLQNQLSFEVKNLRDYLGNLHLDAEMQEALRKNMEEAGHTFREALRSTTNINALTRKALQDIYQSRVIISDRPAMIISKAGNGVQSMVKTDDSGSIVIFNNPKLHLTAHDTDGKLLFDGPIESPEQRDKVPREVWERAEPMLEKMNRRLTGVLSTKSE
jgi:hypothetical protein